MVANVAKLNRSPLDVVMVRAAMAQRGWRVPQLAEKIGVTRRALTVRLSEGLNEDLTRRKIESVFDFEINLGCDAKTFDFRRRCKAALGFDPVIESKEVLKVRCEQLGVRDWRAGRSKEGLIEKLQAHCVANPSLLQPKPR